MVSPAFLGDHEEGPSADRPAGCEPHKAEVISVGFMDKVKEFLSGHKTQTDQAVDKGGNVIDEKTGERDSGQVETGEEKAKDYLDRGEQT